MPKSRRNKLISLTSVEANPKERKSKLLNRLQDAIGMNRYVWVLHVANERTNHMQGLRQELKPGTVFFGKNKLMRVALGKFEDDAHDVNTHLLSQYLTGSCAILATNAKPKKVISALEAFSRPDYARSGFKANATVKVDEGHLAQFAHSLEPELRKLGLPTRLLNGKVMLERAHVICTVDDILTPEQARLLRHFDIKLADFSVRPIAMWEQGGKFSLLDETAPKVEFEREA